MQFFWHQDSFKFDYGRIFLSVLSKRKGFGHFSCRCRFSQRIMVPVMYRNPLILLLSFIMINACP